MIHVDFNVVLCACACASMYAYVVVCMCILRVPFTRTQKLQLSHEITRDNVGVGVWGQTKTLQITLAT